VDAATAARIVHDWAFGEGYLIDAIAPVTSDTATMELAHQQLEITDIGRGLLRIAMITAVGFNQAAKRVVVYTRRAAPRGKRKLAQVPTSIGDVEITYRQSGDLPVSGTPATACSSPPFTVRQSSGQGRYTCGCSVSPGNIQDAGTIGCLVRDAGGVIYGLSANHVTGSCSHADVGLPIVIPGILDVAANSLDPLTIGHHTRSLPLNSGSPTNIDPTSNFDAAIFKIANQLSLSSYQRDVYDTPSITAAPVPNMAVEKVGRTTGHTSGIITAQVHGPRPIQLVSARHQYSAAVYFDPVFFVSGATDIFADNGDSGSLVTNLDGGVRKAVGILVGTFTDNAAGGKKSAVILPIAPILAALSVTLVSGHNI
jgi:hypothetical protein